MLVSNQATKLILIPTLMIVTVGSLAKWLGQEGQEVASDSLANVDTQNELSEQNDGTDPTFVKMPEALDSISPLKFLRPQLGEWEQDGPEYESSLNLDDLNLDEEDVVSLLPLQWVSQMQYVLEEHWFPDVLSPWVREGVSSGDLEETQAVLLNWEENSESPEFRSEFVDFHLSESTLDKPQVLSRVEAFPVSAPLASNLFATPDAPGSVAIGVAEGTRTPRGGKTGIYWGHIDPGNGVPNQGTFSYQHGASSPEEADWKQLKRLHKQIEQMQKQAQAEGVFLSTLELVAGADLANQAPAAVQDYVHHLQRFQAQGLRGSEAVLKARMQSFVNPTTNVLEAGGFGNSWETLHADQSRRLKEIEKALKAQGVW